MSKSKECFTKINAGKDPSVIGTEFETLQGTAKVIGHAETGTMVTVSIRGGAREYVTKTYRSSLLRGSIKNPYYPTVKGIGYVGERDIDGKVWSKTVRGKATVEYKLWSDLINKVASKKGLFKEAKLSNEFLCFQNFAKFLQKYKDLFYIDDLVFTCGLGIRECISLLNEHTLGFIPKKVHDVFNGKGQTILPGMAITKYRINIKYLHLDPSEQKFLLTVPDFTLMEHWMTDRTSVIRSEMDKFISSYPGSLSQQASLELDHLQQTLELIFVSRIDDFRAPRKQYV